MFSLQIFMGIQEWLRKRRVSNSITNIAVIIREVEEYNTKIVRNKLNLYHKLLKKNESLEKKATKTLIEEIEWQKKTFEGLSTISYIVETETKDVVLELDDIPKYLYEKVIEARGLIDSLKTLYEMQLNSLRALIDSEQKCIRFRSLLKSELGTYKKYQNLKKNIPLEALADVEVEWKENRMFIGADMSIKKKIIWTCYFITHYWHTLYVSK